MRRRVVLSRGAAHDLAAAREWLSQPGSGRKAAERLAHIRSTISRLRIAPERWPVVEHPGVREVTVSGYRVLYEVAPETSDPKTAGHIRILRIFGPGQDRTELHEELP